MRLESEDRITYIVIVRNLNVVADDNVLKFCGVADNALASDESAASDECTLTDFCLRSDDAWSCDIS